MPATSDLPGHAGNIYEAIRNDPIVSPHGHCDPRWFAGNDRFANPAALIVIPDHYLFRMLYSQGVPLEQLGIGSSGKSADPREVFRLLGRHWHLFLGTPSRTWLEHTFRDVFGITTALSAHTADRIYDQIEACLQSPDFTPRAMFDRFNIEVLATTDAATDDLAQHQIIRDSGWSGRVIPTFRPDAILDPSHSDFHSELETLQAITNRELSDFESYLAALRDRRQAFIDQGATATDHAIENLQSTWLDRRSIAALFDKIRTRAATEQESATFYAHMLVEMAQMSVEDGLVMQLHAGSQRNTNAIIMERFGRDMGADIPTGTNWVVGLETLLNRVGNDARFRLILFTLDETTYSRELAPMAGHWPCLRIGPPWWFHDSINGISRFFDQVVETAGYWNLAGFNDDTRAFPSIPARHSVWRQGLALHLGRQLETGKIGMQDAVMLARLLSTDLARDTYRLDRP